MRIFALLCIAMAVYAIEALVSYPKECRSDFLNIERKTVEYIYFGHFQDKPEYLDKNGIIELKISNIDMLCIASSALDGLGIKKDKLPEYGLKSMYENGGFIFIVRSGWFESLPKNTQAILIRQ